MTHHLDEARDDAPAHPTADPADHVRMERAR